MPLRAEYTLHQSDLAEFLAAPVWEETNGGPLSVLSALARLDVDPWAEAARLAALPRDAAASALSAILRRLPGDTPDAADVGMIANRLVELLPSGGSATTTDDGEAGRVRSRIPAGNRLRVKGAARYWLILILLVLLIVSMRSGFWS
ncbi:hypothetical protein HL658_21400 [Azospirillum sp. RWY-5-1]|uniref:Uncharacterized protein n=1 Tax=Azospirillum oleiclasticum TaxID=2735135 RepID=A0ABX2TFD5_9PROT|nr:hypothetical protein [Azospirillum oleiclasticum]NYZ15107.1 hypothetical protein [Azospirillum oleiclasticum]NYZ22869.1 hypothetical protein [Azospirillum oleiclasticum]